MAIDGVGTILAFDPQQNSPAVTTLAPSASGYESSVACPAATECVATFNSAELTFDPLEKGGSETERLFEDANPRSVGLACPTTTQCTVLEDDSGQVTFDPTSSETDLAQTSTLQTHGSNADYEDLACPSTTECVAGDPIYGPVLTFTPQTGATQSMFDQSLIDPSVVGCASVTSCFAIGQTGIVECAYYTQPVAGAPSTSCASPEAPPTASAVNTRVVRGVVDVTLGCLPAGDIGLCAVDGKLTTGGRSKTGKVAGAVLGQTRIEIRRGEKKTLAIKLNGRGRRLLDKNGKLKLSVTVIQIPNGRTVMSRTLVIRKH